MQYKVIPLLFFSCLSFLLTAQEQIGLRTENYSGINSVFINPANNLTTPFHWDLNLVAAGQFIDNNFGGFRNSSLGGLANARDSEFFLATDFPSDQQFPAGSVVFDFSEPGKDKFAGVITTVTGPAFMLNFEKQSFGLFTNFRAALGGHKIPAVLGYYDYQSVAPGNDYSIFPSSVAGMVWSELGINYMYKVVTNSGQIGIGINLKYLHGYESFFVNNYRDLNITKMARDILTFQNGAVMDFGFTTSSLDEESAKIEKNGTGFGFDFGLTYASDEYIDGYGFKLGLSILDIGKITFDQRTEYHLIDINEPFSFNPRNIEGATDFREGLEALNNELYNNTDSTFQGTTYDLHLPTALSLQADFALIDNVYLNATLIQRIPTGNVAVERGNLFALTPRYETRWVSAFLPISIYNWQHVQVGTAIRLAFITIGSENLGSIFGQKNLTGADFYAALKINPFRLGWKGGGKKGKAMKCYEF